MGKPSFTKLPPGSSQSSRSCSRTSLLSAISTQKRDKSILRHKKRQRKSIQNLFKKLREDSLAEDSSSSIVLLDDTVIHKPASSQDDEVDGPTLQNRDDRSLIVLDDEEALAENNNNTLGPVCSTPLMKKSKSHNRLDMSNICKLPSDKIDLSNNDDPDRTQIINMNSFVTVDLTEDSAANAHTVIDLSDEDCESSQTDADYRIRLGTMNRFCEEFVNLPRLNKLQVINTIFSGCDIIGARLVSNNDRHVRTRRIQTDEEVLIDDTLMPSRKLSRNSVGSNIYNPHKPKMEGLRMIVIDGSNVAMSNSHGKVFNVRNLQTCIDYFLNRGHVVKAFVPRFRCKYGKSSDPALLQAMNRQGTVVFTPSREVMGRLICSYDDRFIVQCAAEFDAVIVSGDNYRDLMGENTKWRRVIENNLLMYTWVNDVIMFPKDPFGRYGRTLNQFLKH